MATNVVVSPVNMKQRVALGLRAGDTVRVWQKIEELKKTTGKNKKEVTTRNVRKQAFEGLVLAVKHGSEAGGTFTVRKVASGVGVEKIFPLYSPMIDDIEVLRRARTRRAKLYFIRRKAAKEAKHAMRKTQTVNMSTLAMEKAEAAELAAATPDVPEVVETVEATPEESKAAVE